MVAQSDPIFLDFITGDGYVVCPLDAHESIWNSETALPIGKLSDSPDSIALIAIPMQSIEPFKPLTVTIEQLRAYANDGFRAFFIRSDGRYGNVELLHGEVQFRLP